MQWNELVLTPWQEGTVAGILVFFICLAMAEAYHKWGPRREQRMDPKRERFIKACLADIVTEGMEILVEEKVLGREEVDTVVYHRLGNLLKAYDLLPRTQLTLSQSIRSRLFKIFSKIKKQEEDHKPRDFKRKAA